jgi:SAM-dependent methyltransferase
LSHPERIIPDEVEPGVVALHLKRYGFAAPWCAGHDVLDVACGAGYGTAALSETARSVVGGDVDEATIAYAKRRYARPNVRFEVVDAQALPYADASFDTVCSFETIEHLDRPEALVREAARVLRADGAFLVSTPQASETTHAPENPYHRVEFARADFVSLLEGRFTHVELFGQRRLESHSHRMLRRLDVLGLRRRSRLVRRASALTGTPATEFATEDDVVIDRSDVEHATELFAVCTQPRT